jgi:hypothetical protein
MEPYFMEFLPLLRRRGGVAGFERSMAFERFFPASGYDGSLSRAEDAYVKRLIARGARLRRIPCLACKRSLGRLRALKRLVGGTHIVLQRQLLHQWRSYREQVKFGNSYFLKTLLRTIALNRQEPFIAFLGDFVRNLPGGSADIVSSELDNDDLFAVFVAFHFYSYVLTLDDSDLMIRTSDLPDPDYRRATENLLESLTGLSIDLGDARESAVLPWEPLNNVEKVRRNIDELCDRARRTPTRAPRKPKPAGRCSRNYTSRRESSFQGEGLQMAPGRRRPPTRAVALSRVDEASLQALDKLRGAAKCSIWVANGCYRSGAEKEYLAVLPGMPR